MRDVTNTQNIKSSKGKGKEREGKKEEEETKYNKKNELTMRL